MMTSHHSIAIPSLKKKKRKKRKDPYPFPSKKRKRKEKELIWNYQLKIHQGWDVYNKESDERVWKEKYAEYVERPKSKFPDVWHKHIYEQERKSKQSLQRKQKMIKKNKQKKTKKNKKKNRNKQINKQKQRNWLIHVRWNAARISFGLFGLCRSIDLINWLTIPCGTRFNKLTEQVRERSVVRWNTRKRYGSVTERNKISTCGVNSLDMTEYPNTLLSFFFDSSHSFSSWSRFLSMVSVVFARLLTLFFPLLLNTVANNFCSNEQPIKTNRVWIEQKPFFVWLCDSISNRDGWPSSLKLTRRPGRIAMKHMPPKAKVTSLL